MLLGLSGRIGAGKDTVGSYLVEKHGYTQRAFADKLKEATAALLNIPYELIDDFKENGSIEVNLPLGGDVVIGSFNLTGRQILQRMGTEVGRNIFGKDFWVNQIDISPINCVVTDVRFPNEVEHIESKGGTIIWIDRPLNLQKGKEHESEMLVLTNPVTISNDGTIEELYTKVDRLMKFLEEDGA